ncbi:hypothetical protein AFGD_010395 [Aspergillus flavus]|nr:hypothetical protein AFGD_010395 [Aspergillus flavus]
MNSEAAFQRFEQFVQRAQEDGHELIYGSNTNCSKGFFVQPAIFEMKPTVKGLESDLMTKELFGPLFAVQTYDDASPTGFEDVCELIDAHPFGGARSSGTNDKANSVNVLLRFSSIRYVKDSYVSSSSTLSACHVPE